MTGPTLSTQQLGYCIEKRLLLHDITLRLMPGTMTVVLGPNGAGKTTLIRLLAGILQPTSGAIKLDETAIAQLGRTALARQVAYLPQQNVTQFAMRVEDAVLLGRFPHLGRWGTLRRADYERVAWALDRVGLTEFRDRTLPTLSGGERQRVFLARALAQEAPILLLDEPLTALDIGRQLGLMNLLQGLCHDGHTILAALHDLRSAVEFFPQAVLLHEGQMLAKGPTLEVIRGLGVERAFGVRVAQGAAWTFEPT